jgi:Flp pilus assembly protein TadD
MSPFPEDSPPPTDPRDRAHWDAVEEVSELLHEERFREALAELHVVLQKDGKNPYAFYFLGIALYETGELEPARDAYRACLKLAPAHLGARVALVHVLRALGDLRTAIQEGSKALEQAPGDVDALYAVGMAYYARGDEAAARRFFHAFLEAGPEFESSEEVKALLEQMGERPS